MNRALGRVGLLVLLVVVVVGVGFASRVGAQGSSQDDLLAQADKIAAKVAALRGLTIKKPIKRGVMNREQLVKRLLERVEQEYSAEEIAAEEMALKRLGLLEHDADYLATVIDLLKSQIAGFYDPWEGQLYLADWSTVGGEAVLAHEIDHALQDQHFDLKKWISAVKHNADATLARQALVEGDGTALMLEFSAAEAGQQAPWQSDEFVSEQAKLMRLGMAFMGNAPLALRESLVFPYVSGLQFIAEARKSRKWSDIDAMYRRPPRSTEQIIHPDKYWSDEKPVNIDAVMPATFADYARGYHNVSGELALWIFLREHGLDADVARVAVAGWGGDRLVVYTPPGYKGMVSAAVAIQYSVWDKDADAQEYFAALTRALAELSGVEPAKVDSTSIEYRGKDGSVTTAELRGDAVVMVVGAAPARAAEALAQVWDTWKVKRP